MFKRCAAILLALVLLPGVALAEKTAKDYYLLANEFLGQMDYDDAIALDPEYADAYYGRGTAYQAQEKFRTFLDVLI
ncbi:MAG: hypothetical protein A3J72_02920 [Nitrospirae bacterium RIFCSPHIGHO2_02_FULL_40_19]|nr:MAG: hypothetical protein A3J72_02920 [Nitrospirae bacterium RIFCSPHIGHO2_02_FULL_40_19]